MLLRRPAKRNSAVGYAGVRKGFSCLVLIYYLVRPLHMPSFEIHTIQPSESHSYSLLSAGFYRYSSAVVPDTRSTQFPALVRQASHAWYSYHPWRCEKFLPATNAYSQLWTTGRLLYAFRCSGWWHRHRRLLRRIIAITASGWHYIILATPLYVLFLYSSTLLYKQQCARVASKHSALRLRYIPYHTWRQWIIRSQIKDRVL